MSLVGRFLYSTVIAVTQCGALAVAAFLFLGASVWLGYPGRFWQVIAVIACALGGAWIGVLLAEKIWSGGESRRLRLVPASAATGLLSGLAFAYMLRSVIPNEFFQSLLHGALIFAGGLAGAFVGLSVMAREAAHQ